MTYPMMQMPMVASPIIQQTPVTFEQPAPDRSSADIKGSCQLCESPKHWADKCPIRLYRPPTVATESTDSDTGIVHINAITVGKVSTAIQTISTRYIAVQTMPELSDTYMTDPVIYTRTVSVHTGTDLSTRHGNNYTMINLITMSIMNVADL